MTRTAKQESHTFKTILLTAGKTATGIKIPAEIIEKIGAGKKPAVRVTINDFTYRSTVAVMGGDFMIGVNAQNREAAGVKGGDKIEVTLALDTEPRRLEIPEVLQKALNRHPEAKAAFGQLSYSRQQVLVLPIANAKTDETRNRNIDKALAALGV